ncbi:MAG: hypothetical protein AB7E85_08340 [Pseudobdellovibrionaceae bacterium]
MITVSQFTSSYSSFWDSCFPALEGYIRVINSGAYKRVYDEMGWEVSAARSALVSEVAFCLAKEKNGNVSNAYIEARKRLSGLPGVVDDKKELDKQEISCAITLARRLWGMLENLGGKSIEPCFDPSFIGCGSLMKSSGDIQIRDCLIEIKSVDRGFRATDFRQLITYFLLDSFSKKASIKHICIMNARRGVYHASTIEEFVYDTSASGIMDIQQKFLSSLGHSGISR